jgi:hypothetical protein
MLTPAMRSVSFQVMARDSRSEYSGALYIVKTRDNCRFDVSRPRI